MRYIKNKKVNLNHCYKLVKLQINKINNNNIKYN